MRQGGRGVAGGDTNEWLLGGAEKANEKGSGEAGQSVEERKGQVGGARAERDGCTVGIAGRKSRIEERGAMFEETGGADVSDGNTA